MKKTNVLKMAVMLAVGASVIAPSTQSSTYAYASDVSNKEDKQSIEQARTDIFRVNDISGNTVYITYAASKNDNSLPYGGQMHYTIDMSQLPDKSVNAFDHYVISYSKDNVSKDNELIGDLKIENFYKIPKFEGDISNRSFSIDGKDYEYTDLQSGVNPKDSSYDGIIKKNGQELYKYRKGQEDGFVEVFIDGRWRIYRQTDLPSKLPKSVYNASYKVVGFEGKKAILKQVSVDESLFEKFPADADIMLDLGGYGKDFKLGDEVKIYSNPYYYADNGRYVLEDKLIEKNIYQVMADKDEDDPNIFWVRKPGASKSVVLEKKFAKGLDIRVGDRIEITENGEVSGQYPIKSGCVESIYDSIGQVYEIKLANPKNGRLAYSMFDNLIKTNAANTLLNKTPKTIKNIQKDLQATVKNSEVLIKDGYKVLLNKDEITKEDEKEAIIEMMRIKFDKKIASDADKTLALSIFKSYTTNEAAKTLLYKTPKTVEKISADLWSNVSESDELIEKALNELK